MHDKKCPKCGLWSTDSAIRCDCGYNFEKGVMEETPSASELTRKKSPFPIISLSLGIIGMLTSPLMILNATDYSIYDLYHSGWMLLTGPILSLSGLIMGIAALVKGKSQRPIAVIGIILAILGLLGFLLVFYAMLTTY
jgi:hypothetical protein